MQMVFLIGKEAFMVKKTAVINDLSGLWRCSLTAAIPVISAMGVQACPVPTAVLSAQTGFPDYYCENTPQYLPVFTDKWSHMNVSFDGIYTGFATDPDQVRAMTAFAERFADEETEVLTDPILGDDGAPYKFFTKDLCEAVRSLTEKATIITPNLTELCLLAGADFASLDHGNWDHLQEQTASICADYCAGRKLSVLVTGILHKGAARPLSEEMVKAAAKYIGVSGSTGVTESIVSKGRSNMIANGIFSDGKWTVCDSPLLPASFSGTGDLFASVMIASAVRGIPLSNAAHLAQKFLSAALSDSILSGVYPPEGTNFEPHLSILTEAADRL